MKAGGEEKEILDFLHAECYEGPLDRRGLRDQLREAIDTAAVLSPQADCLAQEIESVSPFLFLGVDKEKDAFMVELDGEICPVAAADLAYLPRLLRHYSRVVKELDFSGMDPNELSIHGPELAILGIYIRALTNAAPYKILRDLLEAGYEYVDQCTGTKSDRFRNDEALRKALERYKREHPQAYGIAEQLIVSYVAKIKSGSPADPEFWDRLYNRIYGKDVTDIIHKAKPKGHQPDQVPSDATEKK